VAETLLWPRNCCSVWRGIQREWIDHREEIIQRIKTIDASRYLPKKFKLGHYQPLSREDAHALGSSFELLNHLLRTGLQGGMQPPWP
jgi:hypothetical protein